VKLRDSKWSFMIKNYIWKLPQQGLGYDLLNAKTVHKTFFMKESINENIRINLRLSLLVTSMT